MSVFKIYPEMCTQNSILLFFTWKCVFGILLIATYLLIIGSNMNCSNFFYFCSKWFCGKGLRLSSFVFALLHFKEFFSIFKSSKYTRIYLYFSHYVLIFLGTRIGFRIPWVMQRFLCGGAELGVELGALQLLGRLLPLEPLRQPMKSFLELYL